MGVLGLHRCGSYAAALPAPAIFRSEGGKSGYVTVLSPARQGKSRRFGLEPLETQRAEVPAVRKSYELPPRPRVPRMNPAIRDAIIFGCSMNLARPYAPK
jgi:hypothetical protein